MYKIVFYVPATHVDQVKEAVFGAGAGKVGNYDQCCWQTLGQGQFRPLPGSKPWLGQQDTVEKVDEYRVEMVSDDERLAAVIKALKAAHPYEEPAVDVVHLVQID